MVVRLIATVFTAVAATTAMAQPADTPMATPQATQVVPLYVSTNRPLAMLTMGDGAPLPVVFDTGTDENILDSAIGTRAGLKVVGHSTVIDGASGKSLEVPVAAMPDPRISGTALEIKTAQLLDYRSGDEVGVFGPYSFGDRYVVIEAGLNRLRIIPRNSGFTPPGPGHAYKHNLPAVEIGVAGKPYEAVIDTGNDSTLILGANLVKETALKTPARVVGMARSALSSREVLGGELAGSLTVGPYVVNDPEVTFSMPDRAANVGFLAIRHLTIVLDPANKRSWVLDPASEKPRWEDFIGRFGPRTIRLEHGKLTHQRDGRPPFELNYLGGDLFEMPATGDRLQFFRKDGRVVRVELITADGQVAPADRTS